MLISLGVSENQIFEVGGENTSGEMAALKQFLDTPPSQLKKASESSTAESGPLDVGLITSAFHMPRANRLAQAAGLSLHPITCSFVSDGEGDFSARDLIPRADAGKLFALAMKEYLAKLVRR